MRFTKLSDNTLEHISGGNEEDFYNTCRECGKVWDVRDYGYGTDDVIPEWVTGPWCPECRKKLQENKSKD